VSTTVLHVRAILFDFDGVLVDSATAVTRAWTQWGRDHGLQLTADGIHGVRAVDSIRQVAPHLDAEHEALRLEQAEIDLVDLVRAIPGAVPLLAALPDDRWAIVTSGTRRLAVSRLDAIGLPHPSVFITAEDVQRGKPAPDAYRLAAERLGVAAADCVVVEDSPAGVLAGRRAGIPVIAVTTTHDRAEFDDPTLVVDSVAALRCTLTADGRLAVAAAS